MQIVKTLIFGKTTLPRNVEHTLQIIGNAKIVGIRVGRTPLQPLITGAAKVLSNTPYDKLFHLFMILQTTQGSVLLEKNEVINMQEIRIPPQGEYINVPRVPAGITVSTLMQRTARYMGGKFIPYSAYDNNCQNFVLAVLGSIGVYDDNVRRFVKQDTEDIFRHNTTLRKVVNTVTDVAARVNNALQGGAAKLIPNSNKNGLDTQDLRVLLHGCKKFGGTYSKDQIPKRLKKNFWYILNMEDHDGVNGGTHWVCFKNSNPLEYYDSFGFPPPQEVLQRAKNDVLYNDREIQDIKSTACGWFCVACILCDTGPGHFVRFVNMFSNNTKHNDSILKQILKKH